MEFIQASLIKPAMNIFLPTPFFVYLLSSYKYLSKADENPFASKNFLIFL